jgi:hypothetical protein
MGFELSMWFEPQYSGLPTACCQRLSNTAARASATGTAWITRIRLLTVAALQLEVARTVPRFVDWPAL